MKKIKILIIFFAITISLFLLANISASSDGGIDVGGGFGINVDIAPTNASTNQTINNTQDNPNNNLTIVYHDNSPSDSQVNNTVNPISLNENLQTTGNVVNNNILSLDDNMAEKKIGSKFKILLFANTLLFLILFSCLLVLKIKIDQ